MSDELKKIEKAMELTPREMALKAEGEALLKQIAKDKPAPSPILGSDGLPVGSAPETPEEKLQRLQKERRQRIEEMSAKLQEVTEKDPLASGALQTILTIYRLLAWARIELATRDGMTDEITHFGEAAMKMKAEDPEGFDVRQVYSQLKNKIMPFVQQRIREYEAAAKRREAALSAVMRKLGGKGIYVPAPVATKLKKPFGPGQLLIFHGDQPAVTAACNLCAAKHGVQDAGAVYFLATQEQATGLASNIVIMPINWWKNAARAMSTMYDTLQPVLDHVAVMLVVEDLENMFILDPGGAPVLDRKAQALMRLYQWTTEKFVAVIVGDVITEDAYTPRLYGGLPHFGVELREGKLFIDNEEVHP